MSSAILYVAIVAIWACVLIPRWLRRDPPADPEREEAPRENAGHDGSSLGGAGEVLAGGQPSPERAKVDGSPREQRGSGGDRHPGATDHAKVLSARRRLFGMLLVLTAGSGTLAYTRLAAWWVVMPPVVMLFGYLALLRAAAKADAERRERERVRLARAARAAAPGRGGARPAHRDATTARPAHRDATAADAEVIHISASLGPQPAEEPAGRSAQGGTEPYDQYADAKLRAVGD